MGYSIANAVTSYINPTTHLPNGLVVNRFTVAFRANVNFAAGDGGNYTYFSLINGTDNGSTLKFFRYTTNNFAFGTFWGGDYKELLFSDTGAFTPGIWQTYVLLLDTNTIGKEVWIDNVLKGSAAPPSGTLGAANNILLGNNNGGGTTSLNGALCDFGIYTELWTAADRAAYQAGVTADQIQPGKLADYFPLTIPGFPGRSLRGEQAPVVGTTTFVTNPKLILPHRKRISFPTISTPAVFSSYQSPRLPLLGVG